LTKNPHPQIAKYATLLLIDLYKKKIWNDAKTVNVIANNCFSKTSKVVALALHFLNGMDQEEDNESDSDVTKSFMFFINFYLKLNSVYK
jgi:protein SDA1